jgi:hypothetical protein
MTRTPTYGQRVEDHRQRGKPTKSGLILRPKLFDELEKGGHGSCRQRLPEKHLPCACHSPNGAIMMKACFSYGETRGLLNRCALRSGYRDTLSIPWQLNIATEDRIPSPLQRSPHQNFQSRAVQHKYAGGDVYG